MPRAQRGGGNTDTETTSASCPFRSGHCLICLPLTDRLDSLQLVSTTAGLIILVLITDLLGSTCMHDSFWREKRTCKDSAEYRLPRKDVENAVKSGQSVKGQEGAKRESGEIELYELS